jgi:hypothetical protein
MHTFAMRTMVLTLAISAAGKPDLAWVEKLPGISVVARDGDVALYRLSGDPVMTGLDLMKGLVARKWKLRAVMEDDRFMLEGTRNGDEISVSIASREMRLARNSGSPDAGAPEPSR